MLAISKQATISWVSQRTYVEAEPQVHALAPVDSASGTGSFIQLFYSWLNTGVILAGIMATDLDRTDPGHPARLTSEPLEAIQHLNVSLDNQETSTNDGLDFERRSALHSDIAKHTWQAEGYDLADLPRTTWWQRPDYAPRLDELQELLPESLVDFLKRVLNPAADELPDSSRYYFFYLSDCLARPDSPHRLPPAFVPQRDLFRNDIFDALSLGLSINQGRIIRRISPGASGCQ